MRVSRHAGARRRTTRTGRHRRLDVAGDVHRLSPSDGELYDLVDDPGELLNRWDDPSCAAVKDEMLALVKDQTRFAPVALPAVGLVA